MSSNTFYAKVLSLKQIYPDVSVEDIARVIRAEMNPPSSSSSAHNTLKRCTSAPARLTDIDEDGYVVVDPDRPPASSFSPLSTTPVNNEVAKILGIDILMQECEEAILANNGAAELSAHEAAAEAWNNSTPMYNEPGGRCHALNWAKCRIPAKVCPHIPYTSWGGLQFRTSWIQVDSSPMIDHDRYAALQNVDLDQITHLRGVHAQLLTHTTKKRAVMAPRKTVPPEERCMARISGCGSQCSLRRKNGTEYCKKHGEQVRQFYELYDAVNIRASAAEAGYAVPPNKPEIGIARFEHYCANRGFILPDGSKIGLLLGRIDEPRPEYDIEGRRYILWDDQKPEDYANDVWHPFGHFGKKPRKPNPPKKTTKTRKTNAFITFLNQNRDEFTQVAATFNQPGQKVRASQVAKIAGASWKQLTDEQRALYRYTQ